MPRKPKKPCHHPGCPRLTDECYCEVHKPLYQRENSSQRGYNGKWQKARARFLRKHPFCVKCMEQGRYEKATVGDHIRPHRGDPILFWDEDNWQSLCKPCHDSKTWNEDANPVYHF